MSCLFLQPKQPKKSLAELASPVDGSEITSFNITKNLSLQCPNENHFAILPQNSSPANVYRSDDCNDLIAKELEILNDRGHSNLVSQSSIEIEIDAGKQSLDETEDISAAEVTTIMLTLSVQTNQNNVFCLFVGVDHFGHSFWRSTF